MEYLKIISEWHAITLSWLGSAMSSCHHIAPQAPLFPFPSTVPSPPAGCTGAGIAAGGLTAILEAREKSRTWCLQFNKS